MWYALAQTEAVEESRRHRKKVEMTVAHLEPIMRMGRLRPRRPTVSQDDFILATIAQNLRKMARPTQVLQTA